MCGLIVMQVLLVEFFFPCTPISIGDGFIFPIMNLVFKMVFPVNNNNNNNNRRHIAEEYM